MFIFSVGTKFEQTSCIRSELNILATSLLNLSVIALSLEFTLSLFQLEGDFIRIESFCRLSEYFVFLCYFHLAI